MDFRSRAANELDRNLSIEANDMIVQGPSSSEPDIFSKQFREIELRFDRSDEIFWCYMNQKSRPSYTYELGDEIQQVQDWIHST
jgi:DSF synthase